MDHESVQIELPLEARFQLRKIEVEVKEMKREELEQAYLRLVWQQMMERKALAAVLKENNIEIAFDPPSDDIESEIEELCEDGDDPFNFFR